jgi:hypothetical protein
MAITFAVHDVEPLARELPALDRGVAIPSLLGDRAIEGCWRSDARLVAANDANALAQAAHDAFYEHRELVLSPDAVWFTLAQGLATHVALHAETLRPRFVRHEGQLKLKVERTDFVLGQSNPWPEVFSAFSDQIAAHVGKLRELVVCDFSTTTPIARAASEVLVMDTFQAYFEYEFACGCGIPTITLEGSPDDWRSVRARASMFAELGLEHWTRALLPVLDFFVRASEGDVNRAFWRTFFRYQAGSGPSELTGWILTFFPYLKDARDRSRFVPNEFLGHWREAYRRADRRQGWLTTAEGPSLLEVPSGLASAPIRCVDVRDGSVRPLRFIAGLFGVIEDPATRALSPEFGWAVVHDAT